MQDDLTTFSQTTFPTSLWTDFNQSNYGTYELQLMSYATDLLSYNANAQALETVATTVTRLQNFINIARSYDYTLKSAAPSNCLEQVVLDPLGTYPFTISHHLQFSAGGIIFQPVADVAVPAYNASFPPFPIQQGQESYNEVLGITNGQQGQTFQLKNASMLDGTLVLSVGLQSYTLVDNAIEASATELSYTISTDENYVTTVQMGDGVNGIIPPKNQTVTVTYYYGGGLDTNVSTGTITAIFGTADGSAVPAQILSCTNTTPAQDGGPPQSLQNAQQNMPLALKANDRCVAAGDYAVEAVALVPGVYKANAVPGVAYAGASPILLFVVPPDPPAIPSAVLVNQVQVALAPLKMAGKRIQVRNPYYVFLSIKQDCFVQSASPALVVANRMNTALLALYQPDNLNFGQLFGLGDAYDDVSPAQVVGVSRIFYRQFTILPNWASHVNSPPTGNGDIENISVVAGLVQRREWLVRVLAGNIFQVWQRQLGTVSGVTNTLMTDDAADYEATPLEELVNGPYAPWFLRPNPELNQGAAVFWNGTTFVPEDGAIFGAASVYQITANSTTTISVTPGNNSTGLLVTTEPQDPYVVERKEPVTGKILRTTVTTLATATNTLFVVSSTGYSVGDPICIAGGQITVVEGTGIGSITTRDLVSCPVGATVDYLWISQDTSVQFSVVNASQMSTPPSFPTAFIMGDELYVDTYPETGDLQVRAENYPVLLQTYLLVNPIGGV